MTETTTEVIPWTGQVVDTSDPVEASKALVEATAFYYELKAFQDRCRETLRAESDRRGQRTFEVGEYKVEVMSEASAVETIYDVQLLWDSLEKAGLPVERLAELVHYEPRVNGTVIMQLRKVALYDGLIEGAVLERRPRTRSVRVK